MSLCICGHLLNQHELPNLGSYGWNKPPICLVGIDDEDDQRCSCDGYSSERAVPTRRWATCDVCNAPIGPRANHSVCRQVARDRREQVERARAESERLIEPRRKEARTSTSLCICSHPENTHELPNVDGLPRKCVRPSFTDLEYKCDCQEFIFDLRAPPLPSRRPILIAPQQTQGGIVCACGHRPQDHFDRTAPFPCGAFGCNCIAFNLGGMTAVKLQEPEPIEGAGLPPDPGKRKIDL